MQALTFALFLVFVASAPLFASDDQSPIGEPFRLEQGAPPAFRPTAPEEKPEKPQLIHWKPLLLESLNATAWQQTFRLMQEDQTRKRLTQISMFRNWQDNVKALDHWDDQGPPLVNYVAHPLMGAMSGRLLLNNDALGRVVRPSDDGYWGSRFRALAFSAAYSTQWEVGPLSEAMLGLSPKKEGVVDLVITPTVGFGWTLAENRIEEHLVRRIERHGNDTWTRVARMAFTPSRMLANVAGLHVPWYRTDRGLRDEFDRAHVNGKQD